MKFRLLSRRIINSRTYGTDELMITPARILVFSLVSLIGLQACGTKSELGPGLRICAVDEIQACTCADIQQQGCQVCEVEEGLGFNECDCSGDIDCADVDRDDRAVTVAENQHPMTATIDDSVVPFEAQLLIMILPDDYGNESWRVVFSMNLRATVDAEGVTERGNTGSTEAFSEGQASNVFAGEELPVVDGGAVTYPADVDGTWLTREIDSLMISLEAEREMHAVFGLGPKIHITDDDVTWEETGSSAVEFHGPPHVSCELLLEDSQTLVSDTDFESDFCQDALSDLGLTEWMGQ